MRDKSLKIDASVWKKLGQLAQGESGVPWEKLAQELEIPQDEARHLIVSLKDAQQELHAHTGESEEVFQVWDLVQWCQLTQVLEELVARVEVHDLRPLVIPLLKQQRQHPAYPVYVQLRQRWQEMCHKRGPQLVTPQDEFKNHKVRLVEVALLEKNTLVVECMNGKLWSLIPCKLTYLEGELALIAEETHDHGLVSLDLSEIKNIKSAEKIKSPRASLHEVAEFITALRSMAESDTRLVLKIKNPEEFNLLPEYQFLGKPCLITNPEGDLIWAAWVEPCDELFEWLTTMDEHVEILEPSEFVLDYAVYCEEKLRKMA
jgi:hypothetical protein